MKNWKNWLVGAVIVLLAVLAVVNLVADREQSQEIASLTAPQAPDLSAYALKSELSGPVDLSAYALKSEIPVIPDLSNVVTQGQVDQAVTLALSSPDVTVPIMQSLVDRQYEPLGNRCPILGQAEMQPVNPAEFIVGGQVYGIAAFGSGSPDPAVGNGCWFTHEGQDLFDGWDEIHNINVGFGAQEDFPWRQGTVRIYPTEGFSPLDEARVLAQAKCLNVEEDEDLSFVQIQWSFHGKWTFLFTCADVAAGSWPEVPAEALQPQEDEWPLCSGVPNGDPVCGGETVAAPEGSETEMCIGNVTMIGENAAGEAAAAAFAPSCLVLLDLTGGAGIYVMPVSEVASFTYTTGSWWAIPSLWDYIDVARNFAADICARGGVTTVPISWPGGSETYTCP